MLPLYPSTFLFFNPGVVIKTGNTTLHPIYLAAMGTVRYQACFLSPARAGQVTKKHLFQDGQLYSQCNRLVRFCSLYRVTSTNGLQNNLQRGSCRSAAQGGEAETEHIIDFSKVRGPGLD